MTENLKEIADILGADWGAPRAQYRKVDVADVDQAYGVAALLQERMVATRGPIAGRKIALSSKAMQQMVGLDTPLAGAIFANDVYASPAKVPLADFRHLGLEYELAFEMAEAARPGQGVFSPEHAFAMVSSVRPAFELIEDKGADYSDLHGLTLAADNAWCGGIVLGEPIPGWKDLDLAALPSTLRQDGMDAEPGNTGAADPLVSLAWVLNHVTGRGETIEAGQQVITGSVLRTRFPSVGDRLRYEIDGLASVSIEIV